MWRWESIALGYFSYLALVAILQPRFVRARWPAIGVAAAAWLISPLARTSGAGSLSSAVDAVIPVPVLLCGYWVSGLFFLRPMPRVERWLQHVDRACLRRRDTPDRPNESTWLATYFELAYLLVYLVVPAGALTLVLAGNRDAVGPFWTTVMLAAFSSYGMLPWIQTRPPRALVALDRSDASMQSWSRRFNLWLLSRTSIQVNTVPSGHAATAVAVALSVGAAIPETRVVLLAISASIVIATVAGRYHYVVDSLAGVLVGAGAWALVGWLGRP
jgi:membrane-associated phospholipid phosphatase